MFLYMRVIKGLTYRCSHMAEQLQSLWTETRRRLTLGVLQVLVNRTDKNPQDLDDRNVIEHLYSFKESTQRHSLRWSIWCKMSLQMNMFNRLTTLCIASEKSHQ